MTPLEVAYAYIDKGWSPIPVRFRSKKPFHDDWPKLRITRETVAGYFNGEKFNIGVLAGEPSGNLVDIDLDCAEALALAPRFLPPTGSIFGRKGKPNSHWLYTAAVPKTVPFKDPGDGDRMLLELRSTGGQTVFPGSVHESGERIAWTGFDEPMLVDRVHLVGTAADLAVACLLVRAAPVESRHDYLLHIAGGLIRAYGAAADRIHHAVALQILGKLYNKAEGDRLIEETKARIAKNDPACGWPRLVERVGAERARAIAHWLGFVPGEAKPNGEARPEGAWQEQPWPAPLAKEAYHGLIGEIVRKIEPETEADPAALLFQLLAAVGSALGDNACVRVEADQHPPRLDVLQVGRTAKGRKGTSWGHVRRLMGSAATEWATRCIASGLSSGEGLIHAVRDPVEKRVKGKIEVVDEGVTDKRLLVFEGEFAKALRVMDRTGNTLSPVLRDAWDHGSLRTLVRNSPLQATGAHISLVGHITDDELRRYLDRTEMGNGFANRLIFVCVQRSKLLPRGGRPIDWEDIGHKLGERLAGAPTGIIGRTEAAWRIWEAAYPTLSADRPGLLGAILGRAEAQVLRIALVYALLDGKAFIDEPHMLAGGAVSVRATDYLALVRKVSSLNSLFSQPDKVVGQTTPVAVAPVSGTSGCEKSEKSPATPMAVAPGSDTKACEKSEESEESPATPVPLRPWQDDRAWIADIRDAVPGDARLATLFWWVIAAGGWIEGTTAKLPPLPAGLARNELCRELRHNRIEVEIAPFHAPPGEPWICSSCEASTLPAIEQTKPPPPPSPRLEPDARGEVWIAPMLPDLDTAPIGRCDGCGFTAPLSDRRLCGACEWQAQTEGR